jgi:sortase A
MVMAKALNGARSKSRRWIERSLLLAGGIAVCIWIWSVASNTVFQNWESWVFDRKIRGERSDIAEYVAEKRGRMAAQVRVWLGIPAAPVPTMSRPHINPPAGPHSSRENDGLVGRLIVPRLHLSAMVREGTGEKTLGLALGHIPGTSLPGQKGNVGVAGHRDTLFRGLREIGKNDLIQFETFEGNYAYRVETTEIVRPQDVSVLNTREYPELTLVTCYPFHYVGSAPQRFIVKARQVSRSQTDEELTAQQHIETSPARQLPANDGPTQVDRTALSGKSEKLKPGLRRVSFEVSKDHSRQVSPGISLGLTGIERARLRVNGWIWVMPDRRTIWMREQSVREPVIFYGYKDGKQRELVITSVATNSVKGYLLLPEDRTYPRSHLERRTNTD